METYQVVCATGVLPQSATQALTLEINRYAKDVFAVCSAVSIDQLDSGRAFTASVVLKK